MKLKIYNTMGKEIQEFEPIKDNHVGLYGCGPTVYKFAHIGNLRAYVFQDILTRVLSFLGYNVTHVMNITDIGHLSDDGDDGEDKMLKSAREKGMSIKEIADIYIEAFFDDADKLNIKRPSIVCKATEHIEDMIKLIKRIEKNGHTYMANGNLYFDISTFKDYGKLSGIDVKTLKAGARIEIDKNKKNPNDFVLWFTKSKFENHALLWDSPWGKGYPGWHIECSAMSMKYLGEHFDIHTGGIDHIRVHHTNEIAQSESATNKKWVNYWLHNEFLITDKGKMSKSLGETFTLTDIVNKGFSPLDYRFFLLGGHYRKQLTFSLDALNTAKNAREKILDKIAKILENCSKEDMKEVEKIVDISMVEMGKNNLKDSNLLLQLDNFLEAITSDLNIPKALVCFHSVIREKEISPFEILTTVAIMDLIFGLNIIEEAKKMANLKNKNTINMKIEEIIKLIEERNDAKRKKDYKKADEIRDKLKTKGILLEDTKDGTLWKYV